MNESANNKNLSHKYLLLQVRDDDDPMCQHEIDCFARGLGCDASDILVHPLIQQEPNRDQLQQVAAVLIGGSGKYSVSTGGPWLPAALDAFEFLYEASIPTFASCWGFQAFARALGGRVVTDLNRAELGTLPMTLTEAGLDDPVFGPLGSPFYGQLGHQDIVEQLPDGAVLLASSDKVSNEAYTFPGKPVYATQFHPELTKADLITRMQAYPVYLQKITGMTLTQFREYCRETPESSQLLDRFANLVVKRVRQ